MPSPVSRVFFYFDNKKSSVRYLGGSCHWRLHELLPLLALLPYMTPPARFLFLLIFLLSSFINFFFFITARFTEIYYRPWSAVFSIECVLYRTSFGLYRPWARLRLLAYFTYSTCNTHTHTHTQTHTHTHTHTDTDRQTDRHTHTDTHTHISASWQG